MTIHEILNDKSQWFAPWFRTGQVCYQGVLGGIRQCPIEDVPNTAVAIGCGGWDEDGTIHWIGLDIDVGHGTTGYPTRDEAADAALSLRSKLGGAANVHFSKSGTGVHVFIPIPPTPGGAVVAGRLAKWISSTFGLRADASPLGRQNFWIVCKEKPHEYSFQVLAEAEGVWTPPQEALEPPAAPPAPTLVVLPGKEGDGLKEALAYLEKVPGAVAGQGGHDTTYHVACLLRERFGLGPDESMQALSVWNSKCDPAWSTKDLEHKVKSAAGKVPLFYRPLEKEEGDTWYAKLLASVTGGALASPAEVKPASAGEVGAPTPSQALSAQIEEEIAGKRFAAPTGWPVTDKLTRALLPGTITMLCAPQGSSKSFAIIQMGRTWMSKNIPFSILMMEEDRTYHLRRAVAQEAGNAKLTDDDFCRRNGETVRELLGHHGTFADAFGKSIHEVLDSISTKSVLEWLSDRVRAGDRCIAIDPITAKDPSQKPYIDDHLFMMGAKKILRTSQASLILVTHPPKTSAKDKKGGEKAWGDDVAGGASYLRFAQTVLWLDFMNSTEEVVCMDAHGLRARANINRRLQLRKTRNARGQGSQVGLYFDPADLTFKERGVI